MNEANIKQILEMQKENYANRIGTTFGIFRIDDIKYNWQAHTQEWTITCTKCGYSETVTQSVGWDWLRGKGRCRDKCIHCKELEREAEKNAKIKKTAELEQQLNSVIGQIVNGWFVESRNSKTYYCVCEVCKRNRKLSYKQLVEDGIICKRCDTKDFSDPSFIGKRYGNLTVLSYANGDFRVKCDCGFEKVVNEPKHTMGRPRK